MMDIRLFIDVLSIDSTSGRERALADFLSDRLLTPANKLERFEDNLLFSWGKPDILFCTHLDTVPPFILPTSDSDGIIRGRGTCDAKGQIFAMWEACRILEAKGYSGFGLLLLTGEETGSYGAKSFLQQHLGAEWVVVGEPTDNHMATAAKGTKSFEVTFTGKAFHSGYPENGISAVEMFNDFMNALRSIRFPEDELLGETTWNVGKLISDNPQNILSPELTCRVYFRTTFESDEMVCNIMKNIAGPQAKLRFGRPKVQDGSDIVAKDVAQWQKSMAVVALGGDTPTRFETIEGFPQKPVSFGSDAPQLTNCPKKILCGPGSILVAHRPEEHILLKDIETAVQNYIRIAETILSDKNY
jgi:acetylornithine deacetylase